MTVRQIVPVDKRRSRVFLEEDISFALYRGELGRYGIEEGAELPEERYQEILTNLLCRRARERAVCLLKAADKTESELRQKLLAGYYPPEAIDYAIAFLKDYRYIDDESYAQRYAASKASRKSRRQISCDLRKKGISQDMARQILEECPVEEEEQIRSYMRKKGYEGRELTRAERQKAAAALGRRGYSYDMIERALGRSTEEEWP